MIMKNIVIISTGAVAAEITSYLDSVKDDCDFILKGYLDYDYNVEKYYKKYRFSMPIIGDIETYIPEENDYFILGVANIDFRKKVISTIKNKGGKFFTFIHPTAIVAKDAKIGEGCIISPFCMIGPNTLIGDFNHLTSYSFISHDCIVGNNNLFSSAGICGNVTIGNNNSFYIKSTVVPNVTIENNCIIQAGMLLDKSIKDESIVFYRFKEKIISVPKNCNL